MRTNVRGTVGVLLTAMCATVALAACGSSQSRAGAGADKPASVRTEDSRQGAPDSDIVAWSQQVAKTPYFATSDYSGPQSAATFATGSNGLIRGTVVGVERGPDADGSLHGLDNGVPVTRSLVDVTLGLRVTVSEVQGEAAGSVKPDDEVVVAVTVWRGPADFEQQAVDTYLAPLIKAAPSSMSLLVAVSKDRAGEAFTPFGIATTIVAGADGKTATNLTAPSTDGTVWGTTDLQSVARAAAAGLG